MRKDSADSYLLGNSKEELDTPVLCIDLPLLEANIARMAAFLEGGPTVLRPHTKTHKSPLLAYKQLAAGAIGVTCAKLGEGEVMAQAGISEILIANQIVGRQKIHRLINRSADFLVMMVEKNVPYMQRDPGRFHFNYSPDRDNIITEASPDEKLSCFVDTVRTKQHFYYIGTAMAALADMYAIKKDTRFLDAALHLAEFERRLNPQGLRWLSYSKVGWGAAELYAGTGSPDHRIMAANVSEVAFMAAQTAYGGWENMYYPLRDHGVWESVKYHGSGHVPKKLPDDGSWAWLAGQEIAGEFLGEMGLTLASFKAALGPVEARLSALLLSAEEDFGM